MPNVPRHPHGTPLARTPDLQSPPALDVPVRPQQFSGTRTQGRQQGAAKTTGQPMTTQEDKRAELRKAALEYHEFPTPGKSSVTPTKQLINQRDLALAYAPGVAAACEEIVADPANAFRYTARGNLVAVITNGTAVLGLGNIGPLASKP